MNRREWICGCVLALLAVLSTSAVAQQGGLQKDELFGKLDRNGDGTITADEIGDGQQKSFERLLRVGDADKDGNLTRAEFNESLKPLEPTAGDSRNSNAGPNRRNQFDFRQFFKQMDRDGNGKLTLSEVPEQLRPRLKPVFDRLGKEELTVEDFARARGAQNRRAPNPEESFKRLDRNGDGKLTKSELPEFLQRRFRFVFERLKKDEITLKEFIEAVRRASNPAEVFKRFDTNSDGKLSLKELPEGLRPQFKPLFERQGKDELTVEEFSRATAARRNGGRQDPKELFKRLDQNGDGKLTLKELPDGLQRQFRPLFERLDKDTVTQEEFSRALGRRRAASPDQRKRQRPESRKRTGTAGRPGREKKRPARKTDE